MVFEAMVKSKLLYGGDVWWAGQKELGKLETVQNDFIRWASGYQRKDRVSVSNLRREMHMKSVEDCLCIKRLMWLGRLTRMDGHRLVSQVWGAECVGKRAPGRQRLSFQKIEGEDLAKAGVLRADALEKGKWVRAVRKVGEVVISDPVDDPM